MALSTNIVSSIPGGGLITAYPTRAFDITPGDDESFTVAVTVWVGGTGTITVEPWEGGNTVTFAMVDGAPVPVAVRRVLSTGTTATDLIGIY